MPKATLTFNLPEEQYEHACALHGRAWKSIIYDVLEQIRQKLKYGHSYKSADSALEDVRNHIISTCIDYNLDPWKD